MSLRSLSSDLLDGVGVVFCTLWVHEMFGASTTMFFVRVVCPYTVFDGVPVRFSLFVHELFDREPVCFSAICVYP